MWAKRNPEQANTLTEEIVRYMNHEICAPTTRALLQDVLTHMTERTVLSEAEDESLTDEENDKHIERYRKLLEHHDGHGAADALVDEALMWMRAYSASSRVQGKQEKYLRHGIAVIEFLRDRRAKKGKK
jgi:hypothetical protein